MNYFKEIKRNPKLDKDYFCSKCGTYNNYFYLSDARFMEKHNSKTLNTNICDTCIKKFNSQDMMKQVTTKLWGHEKAIKQNGDNEKAG